MERELNGEDVEKRISEIIEQMTLEEKVQMCHANSTFCSGGCERLGISEVIMSDGPHGVRAEVARDSWAAIEGVDDAVTYLPTGITLGATWNRECALEFGQVLGAEARSRAKDIILGPGVNIIRTPLCGRNFEYIGEDPCHAGICAAAVIEGIQQNDVAACVKHFALNNQELDRMKVDVDCDERTLREIYLPAFEAAVKQGGVLTVMGAYNRFEGQHCCHHQRLLNEILKEEWGFAGLVVSDWGGVHATGEAALNGLDIEMGGNLKKMYLDKPFLEGICDGRYPEELVDEKVRRILRVLQKIKHDRPDRAQGSRNTLRHQQIARKIAAEAVVLLKNDNELLPLERTEIKKLAVIGENAVAEHAAGGGSSGIKALYEITPLTALRELLEPDVEIVFEQGYPSLPHGMIPVPREWLSAPDESGVKGWKMEIYANRSHSGKPVQVDIVPEINFACDRVPLAELDTGGWSIVWSGELTVPQTERLEWVLQGGDNWVFKIDGTVVNSAWDLTLPAMTLEEFTLEAGHKYRIEIELHPKQPGGSMRLGCVREGAQTKSAAADPYGAAVAAARDADAVLFFGGCSHMQDCEGQDRRNIVLPGGQNELIEALAKANPRLAVVLFGGSAVRLPWVKKVPAVLQAWYPGSEGGRALADILFGMVNPSGRLPFSWPVELQDCAAHAHEAYAADKVEYKEGLFTGYRWHDREEAPEPLFAFGYGKSYTSFTYEDAAVMPKDGDNCAALVEVTVRNTGTRAGAETVQLYIHQEQPSVSRPYKELKNFAKIFLPAGASRRIKLPVTRRDLSYYDVERKDWVAEAGGYKLMLGASALDIRCELPFHFSP